MGEKEGPASTSSTTRLDELPRGYRVGLGAAFGVALPGLVRLFAAEKWSPDRVRVEQERRLARIVRHAGLHSPHYRQLFRECGVDPLTIRTIADLARLPVLEKDTVRAAGERLLSETVRPGRRDLAVVVTSGSTGAPLPVVVDRAEAALSLALILYAFLRCGLRPGDRLAYLWAPTGARPRGAGVALGPIRETRLDLRRGPAACLDELDRLRPDAIYGFPSVLRLMAEEQSSRRRERVRPRVIVVHGEVLTPAARRRLAEVFDCPVRNTYGSAEFNRLAFECSRGSMHLIPLAALVETDAASPEAPGDALVTSLYHKTMPFIRYRLGDRLVLRAGECACGLSRPVIAGVEGRLDDDIALPSGRRVSPRAVNLIEEAPGVLEHQILQRRPELIEVFVRPRDAGPPPDLELVARIVREGCLGEPVEILVRSVPEIPRTAAGKRRAVVSEIQ